MENQDLEHSILILSRTRRNLSASANPERSGPNFLDKALAKQISVRQSELDLNLQRCGSVIVRASTPDPRGAPCDDNCLEDSVFEVSHQDQSCPTTLSQTPDSFSIPQQNSLSHQDTTAPSVRGLRTPVITRAPLVPWSPSRPVDPQRSSQPPGTSRTGSLLEILTESASLLHPLFATPSNEQVAIMDVGQSQKACRKKERIFNQLARRFDVDENNYDWDTIAGSKDSWIEQLNGALNELVETAEEMIDDHRNALGSGEVQAWQSSIKEAEKVYALTIKKFYKPNPNGIQLPSSASLPPVQSNHQAQAERAAQVNIDIDDDIV